MVGNWNYISSILSSFLFFYSNHHNSCTCNTAFSLFGKIQFNTLRFVNFILLFLAKLCHIFKWQRRFLHSYSSANIWYDLDQGSDSKMLIIFFLCPFHSWLRFMFWFVSVLEGGFFFLSTRSLLFFIKMCTPIQPVYCTFFPFLSFFKHSYLFFTSFLYYITLNVRKHRSWFILVYLKTLPF